MQNVTRRHSFIIAAVMGLGAFASRAARAAAEAGIDDMIAKIAKGRRPGRSAVTLDLPEIAENGNSVPVTVKVTSPMTEQLYVAQIIIIAEANPTPTAATFTFTPLSGKAEVSTRIRLAQTRLADADIDGRLAKIERPQLRVKVGEMHERDIAERLESEQIGLPQLLLCDGAPRRRARSYGRRGGGDLEELSPG